jgi:hypothetical protein
MTFNLNELTSKIAKSNVQATDAMTAKYLEDLVKHMTEGGDKIDDYPLALVSQPRQIIETCIKRHMQHWEMSISALEQLPTFDTEENKGEQ